ncbi:MAG: thioredoxin-related protein [Candidatus Azotimanducaceae bacterium]|jgi:thioredoxin-related protein
MMRVLAMLLCCYGAVCEAEPGSANSPHVIVAAKNLAREGAQAIEQRQIFLLYVSRPQCPYCAALEKEVLMPMLKNPSLMAKVHLRELSWDAAGVVDFQGHARNANALIEQLAIPGAPTLLFLDGAGRELAPSIVGYYSRDFYWVYFERAVAQAYALVADKAQKKAAQ